MYVVKKNPSLPDMFAMFVRILAIVIKIIVMK